MFLSETEQAKPHLTKALEMRTAALGTDHPSVAVSLREMAMYLREIGRQDKAMDYAQRSLDTFDRLGIENDDRVESLHVLQLVLLELDRPEEAKAAYEEAARIAGRLPKPPASMANVMHDYARQLAGDGQLEEGLRIAKEAVALHRKEHGSSHRETAYGLLILGDILNYREEYSDAESTLREALSIFTRYYGEEHPSVRVSAFKLVKAVTEQGDTLEVTRLLQQYPWLLREERDFAVAIESFPVERARGKTIAFTGWIKTEDLDGNASLWWRADGGDESIAFDNMADRSPNGTTDWRQYEVELEIPEEATNINFGVLLSGSGSAWFDDLSVAIDGKLQSDHDIDFDFEGEEIKGYNVPFRPRYRTSLDASVAKSGEQSLRMEGARTAEPREELEIVDHKQLQEYGGRFKFSGRDDSIVILPVQGQLHADVGSGKMVPLNLVATDRFSAGGGSIEFRRDADGEVTGLTHRIGDKELVAERWRPADIEMGPLTRYTGEYLYDGAVGRLEFFVTSEETRLFVRLTGQGKVQVYPASENRFSYEIVLADIEFHENDAGEIDALTLYQGGGEMRADRVSETDHKDD